VSEVGGPPNRLLESLGNGRLVEFVAAEQRAVLEFDASPEMCHSGDVVQGGFVTGWIDAAMAHAAIAAAGEGVTPMSLEIKVSFFAPVRPGLVIAEGWIERRGRKTCFCEGHLLDRDGKVLAKGTSTIMLADRAKVESAARVALGGG
jgi:uncharacterized protein (TIGR00369 family)